jgi:hypothetical protein
MDKNASLYSNDIPRRGPEEGHSHSSRPHLPNQNKSKSTSLLGEFFNYLFGTGDDMCLEPDDIFHGIGMAGYPEMQPSAKYDGFTDGILDGSTIVCPPSEPDVHVSPLIKKIGPTDLAAKPEFPDADVKGAPTVTKKDEPEVIARDKDGWPLPLKDYRKGYVHCSESQMYHHETATVGIKGHSTKAIWPGKGELGFCFYEEDGITCARIYDQRKNFISHQYFQGKPTRDEIRKILFDEATWNNPAVPSEDRPARPYKVTFRHIILSKAEFDKQYTPNVARTSTYGSSEDKALKSLAKIMSNASWGEVESGAPHSAFNLAHKEIRKNRRTYIVVEDEFPCVEVFAYWHNLDAAAGLIFAKYDSMEPVLYHINHFNSAEEMETCEF